MVRKCVLCAAAWLTATACNRERQEMLDLMVNVCRARWKAYLCLVRRLPAYCTEDRQKQFAREWLPLMADLTTTRPTNER